MSEVLEKTWLFLTSSGSGPKWTVPSSQSSPSCHLPHGLAQYMKSLYDSPTNGGARELAARQMQAVNSKLKEKTLKTTVLSDCVVRAMISHIFCPQISIDFVKIHALELAQKGNTVPERKIGYLACSMMLQNDDQLLLLLINTIVRDLKSEHVAEINMALVAATYMTPVEMVPMILPIVMQRATHNKVL